MLKMPLQFSYLDFLLDAWTYRELDLPHRLISRYSRGRDAEAPPAQIPACSFPAPGSSVTLASALSNPRQAPSADIDSP